MNIPQTAAWQAALSQVPGAQSLGAVDIRELAGGTTNATFRVRTPQGAFVVRLHAPDSVDLGVDRRREALLHGAAAQAGIASRLIAADPTGRFMVTEYLDGQPWRTVDMGDRPRLLVLAQTLRQLHAVPAPVVPVLDLASLMTSHLARIAVFDAAEAAEFDPQLARARQVLARQIDTSRPAAIIHGDLVHTNVIGYERPRLIDWEYAAVGDPLNDLACLVAYYPGVSAHGAMLLQSCGLSGTATQEELEDLASVYRLLSKLWYRRLTLARCHPPPAH